MLILFLPWVICLLIMLVGFFLYKRWWKVSVAIAVCILGLNWWGQIFTLGRLFTSGRDGKSIKVMTWNIDGGVYDKQKVEGIAGVINSEKPDIVFLSEDFIGVVDHLDSLLKDNYRYSSLGSLGSHHYLYSKFPIDSIAWVKLDGEEMQLRMRYEVRVGNQIVEVYGCHLASNNYSPSNEDFHLDSVDTKQGAYRYLKDIHAASITREKEVDALLQDYVSVHDKPCIMMGDFNDISGSRPLRKLSSANFEDAWWKGGFGYGATIHHPLPYRIDHIMYNDGLKLVSVKKVDANGLSDHDALVGEFRFAE